MGLTTEEAEKRLKEFGPNSIEENKKSMVAIFFSFFWGPIPWMIEVAAILAGLLERWPDLIMIGALLIVNALIGFFQEFKANNAIDALKSSLALKARVKRDDSWQEIEAANLVPGDEVKVKLGNIIPADLKLLEGEYLTVDQSALTGESLPVDKAVGDVAYSGTIAKKGEMTGEVTETGMRTFFGKTAKLVDEAHTKSHFQEAVLKIGHFLIYTTLLIAAIILVTDLYRMEIEHSLHESLGNIAIFMLVLVIAGIPVALPAVLSMTMAIGAGRMAKLKAIVSKLIAIEELAGIDILCSDKTGTLTKNELTVGDLVPSGNFTADDVILYGTLASQQDTDDAIDNAVSSFCKASIEQYSVTKFIPFDPVIKRTEAHYVDFSVTKGAPQVILDLCPSADKDAVNKTVLELASRGFRTLGVAKSENGTWNFIGLIPLFDPPRDDTLETIHTTKNLHIDVKMVTGDHTAIAKEIAGKLDLGTNIMAASEISDHIENADGFAEVFPEHKFQIVKELQRENHIVGMTGDGVNDAPALKQADVGIAVSAATDAARAAADLVLTEPGLMVITHAIEEARCIFGRMKSYAMYRISETVRLLLFLLLAMLAFNTHPLSAIMIILIALLNDIPIMAIAYDHMSIPDKPVKWNMQEVLTIAIGLAVVGVISTFGLYWIGTHIWHLSIEKARTLAFMAILCGGNLTIYLTRNTQFLLTKPLPELKFFLATLFSQILGTLISVYGLGTKDFVGIGWEYVGLSWAYIAVWFFICMFTKEGLYRLLESGKHALRESSAKLSGN